MRSVFGLVGSFAVLVFLATTARAAERVEFSLEFETGDCTFSDETFLGNLNFFQSFLCEGTFDDPSGALSGDFTCTGVTHTNFATAKGESHSTTVLVLTGNRGQLIWQSDGKFALDPETFETLSASGNLALLSAEGPADSFGDEVLAAAAKFVGDGFDLPSTINGHYIRQ